MPPKKTQEDGFDDKVLLDNREKALFWEIVVGSDGGKLYSTLVHGTTTPQRKHDVWEAIQTMFNAETNRNVSTDKLRKLFARMVAARKKKHDDLANKQFTKDCAQTGGGLGPSLPEDEDGDNIEPSMLDPTPTPWNGVSRTGRSPFLDSIDIDISPQTSFSQTSSMSSCSQVSSSKTTRQGPSSLPAQSYLGHPGQSGSRNSSPSLLSPSLTNLVRRPIPSFEQAPVRTSPFSFGQSSPSVSSSPQIVSHSISDTTTEHVVLINSEDGTTESVPIVVMEQNNNKNSKVTKKPIVSKVDAASAYYSKMLSVQTEMSKLKGRLLKSKLVTEQMKQSLLRNQLQLNNLEVPAVSDSSESSSEDGDDGGNL